jgi:hypothetical protein
MIVSSAVVMVSFSLGKVPTVWPDEHNWWIIVTSGGLLVAGLSIAWAERRFLSEQTRIYRSMADLFSCASRRLHGLLARYKAAEPASPEAERLLAEIQSIFYEIGREALDENAEWLIQHRARPLEPFMAG